MRYINGKWTLNKQETADVLFALKVLEQNQNSYDIGNEKEDKELNKQSVSSYFTMRMIAVHLGVLESKYYEP